MSYNIFNRTFYLGLVLLTLPVLFLYHELAWQMDWPLLIRDFPGIFKSQETGDRIMFLSVTVLLPLGVVGTGINLFRMEGSRFFGIVLIILATAVSLAIIILRPDFRV